MIRQFSTNPTAKRAWGALMLAIAACSSQGSGGTGAAGGGEVAGQSAAGQRSAGSDSSGAAGTPAVSAGGSSGTSNGGNSVVAAGGVDSQGVTPGAAAAGGRDASAGGSANNAGNAGMGGSGGASCGEVNGTTRLIAFGTTLNARAQVCESQALARSLADPSSPTWRAKGDQKRTYEFKAAGAQVPYRVVVPATWDGQSKLPLVMFLHGAGNDESSYLDQNNQQLVKLAQQKGYLLVSALGYQGAYGNFLRLPAVFGQPAEAAAKIAEITPDSEKTNELSEKDVINVLELVLGEYPIDRAAMFLTGHSMGSGGTWYIGAKYPDYWAALAPMSGPFVQETGYVWDNLRNRPVFITEGTQASR